MQNGRVRKIAAFIFAVKNIGSEAALGYGNPECGRMRFGRNISTLIVTSADSKARLANER